MMLKLWGWIAAGASLLLAALLLVTGQRDRAREKAKATKVKFQTSEATRGAEHAARKAQADAREQTTEVQREADERPDDRRPTGNLRR